MLAVGPLNIYVQWPYSAHAPHTQSTHRAHSGHTQSTHIAHCRKLYICTETEEEKKEFEIAFRIVGRGGLPPLAGCKLEALIVRPIIVEHPHKHVQYQIQVSSQPEEVDSATGKSISVDSWFVNRRVTAFRNLSRALCQHMPEVVNELPELPTKTLTRNFEMKHLMERKEILQTFLLCKII